MYKLVKDDTGKLVARFTSDCEVIECDFCHRIVPKRYTEIVHIDRNGYHDGRDGYYFGCRDVFQLGSGKIHRRCRP